MIHVESHTNATHVTYCAQNMSHMYHTRAWWMRVTSTIHLSPPRTPPFHPPHLICSSHPHPPAHLTCPPLPRPPGLPDVFLPSGPWAALPHPPLWHNRRRRCLRRRLCRGFLCLLPPPPRRPQVPANRDMQPAHIMRPKPKPHPYACSITTLSVHSPSRHGIIRPGDRG